MKKSWVVLLLASVPYSFLAQAEEVRPDEGLVLIQVHGHVNSEPVSMSRVEGVHLKNLKTGKTYGSARDNLLVQVVPEGVYCVDEIDLTPAGGGKAYFCREPYIKVVHGQLNNAGEWIFSTDVRAGEIKLEKSVVNSDATLERAKKKFPQYFN
jgi:hypothetical protein